MKTVGSLLLSIDSAATRAFRHLSGGLGFQRGGCNQMDYQPKVLAVRCLKSLLKALVVTLVIPVCLSAQDDEKWPPLSYLRSDYKAVSVVAHVRIEQAEITGRIGGYENWKVTAVVVESFKGRLKKGNSVIYFHGAEAGLKLEHFVGEKIVFLLSERASKTNAVRYSVLENSTLQSTPDRVSKLRSIRKQALKSRSGR